MYILTQGLASYWYGILKTVVSITMDGGAITTLLHSPGKPKSVMKKKKSLRKIRSALGIPRGSVILGGPRLHVCVCVTTISRPEVTRHWRYLIEQKIARFGSIQLITDVCVPTSRS